MVGAASEQAAIAAARAWILEDPDPETRALATELLGRADGGDAAARSELLDAFGGQLAFGTAGLRAALGAGPRRMNRVVVTRASAGLAAFLLERSARGETVSPPTAVVGYDSRRGSAVFARDAAETLAGAGIRVTLLPEPLPTPVTAFAVRHLGLSAGIMVTASHNPPGDNGYKVFLGDADGGGQLAPPDDARIAGLIADLWATPLTRLPRSPAVTLAGPEVLDAYVSATARAVRAGLPPANEVSGTGNTTGAAPAAELTIVYTALHGVGSRPAQRVFQELGLPAVVPVPEQDAPDGAFPTVDFPNPEEPGALDLAVSQARRIGADLIVAHDPDADRLALAAPCRSEATGYRRLTGNQLGLLLGWRAAERERVAAEREGRAVAGTLACTIVSSPALREVAAAYGLDYVETLSGFKWISRVPRLLFGFEEALGYLTHPDVVHDKDGISASADAIAMARELRADGRELWDLLDEAGERFGAFASGQLTIRLASAAAATALAARVRARPPTRLAGSAVTSVTDLLEPGRAEVTADVLRLDLENGSRVMVRPSGTEPKLKVYLDTVGAEGSAPERRGRAEAELELLQAEMRGLFDELRGAAG